MTKALTAINLDEQFLSLLDLCQATDVTEDTFIEMIEYGVIEPSKGDTPRDWQFSAYALRRSRVAVRLQRDLDINLSGLALTMDLLEEVEQLRRRVDFFEGYSQKHSELN